jgi:hypothetical protein
MFVTCPICSKDFKEINLPHLKRHQLTVEEYDVLYPNHHRMSSEQKKKKARYQNLTPEMSAKLKFSQSLDGYIEKYGKEEGEKQWQISKENKKKSKTIENFIKLYGTIEGPIKHQQYVDKNEIKMKLEGFISRYGQVDGRLKYAEYIHSVKNSKTINHYMKLYGIEDGIKRWELKNLRNSLSSMKTLPEERDSFEYYRLVVSRLTSRTLRKHTLNNKELIKKGEYVVDHKFSTLEGFKNNIPPYIIASIHNLEVISNYLNCSKQDKCSITLDELLSHF